jgi:hypothetical protein
MKLSSTLGLAVLALAGPASALIGYGIPMYKPNCAYACRSIFADAMLSCSTDEHSHGAHNHGTGPTPPDCRAGNEPWLTTLANCINSTCADVDAWVLEKYWADKNTGDPAVQPKWTYAETLRELEKSGKPTKMLDPEEEMPLLDFTAAFDEEAWDSTRGSLWAFENAETVHSRYGYVFRRPLCYNGLTYNATA